MHYQKERLEILRVIKDLKSYSYINPNGGGISMRCDNDNILTTPTGSAFRRWHLGKKDLVVFDLKGRLVEKGKFLADAEAPLLITI